MVVLRATLLSFFLSTEIASGQNWRLNAVRTISCGMMMVSTAAIMVDLDVALIDIRYSFFLSLFLPLSLLLRLRLLLSSYLSLFLRFFYLSIRLSIYTLLFHFSYIYYGLLLLKGWRPSPIPLESSRRRAVHDCVAPRYDPAVFFLLRTRSNDVFLFHFIISSLISLVRFASWCIFFFKNMFIRVYVRTYV